MVYVVYGFRLRCVSVTHYGGIVAIDFLRLAADIAMGVSLVVGIALEKGGKR
jgi:hypothetical protein